MKIFRAANQGSAQAIIEYLLVAIAMVLALAGSNFLGKMQSNVFEPFFQKAAQAMR
jgi:hypothetical protein